MKEKDDKNKEKSEENQRNLLKRKEPEEIKEDFQCPIYDKYMRIDDKSGIFTLFSIKNISFLLEKMQKFQFLPPQLKSKKSNISII